MLEGLYLWAGLQVSQNTPEKESGKDEDYKQTALSFSDQSTTSSLDITISEIDLSLQKEIKNKKEAGLV